MAKTYYTIYDKDGVIQKYGYCREKFLPTPPVGGGLLRERCLRPHEQKIVAKQLVNKTQQEIQQEKAARISAMPVKAKGTFTTVDRKTIMVKDGRIVEIKENSYGV